MYSIGVKSRFDLLHLQEGEEYLKDFQGSFKLFNPVTRNETSENGTIHFCSHSLILEAENSTIPILKYLYKFMKSPPELVERKTGKALRLECTRLIEVPASKTPQPHRKHELTEKSEQKVEIKLLYSSIEALATSINYLYEESMKGLADFEYQQVVKTFMAEDERFGKAVFDKTRIKDISEKPLISKVLRVKQILPLVQIDGLFYLTDKRIYFQPLHSFYAKPLVSFKLRGITGLYKRRYKLKPLGLEWEHVKKGNNESMYLAFQTAEQRDKVYNAILERADKNCATEKNIVECMHQWVYGKMSNFDYLMHLNSAAYRSFADLSQYPVFPWVLSQYKGSTIDLSKKEVYRDLTKPIGALNPKRLADLKARFEAMPPEDRFLYGTHYSTPAYVISFLLRKNPLHMLKLQSGNFDNPNRLFHSINKEWQSALENPGNVRELIPEFYMNDPSFLMNSLGLTLGIRANKKPVNHVKLPKWAKDAGDFLRIQREALEGDIVSQTLHHWIDLIFGYQQRGEEAIMADNLFHPLSYEGSVDIEKITDPNQRVALEMQIMEFGQTPKQLFIKPHPIKYSYEVPKPLSEPEKKEVKEQKPTLEEQKEVSDSPTMKKSVATPTSSAGSWLKSISNKKAVKTPVLHKKKITFIYGIESDSLFVTGSKDGTAKIFTSLEGTQKKVLFAREAGARCGTPFRTERIIAFGTYDNAVRFYNQQNATQVYEISNAHDDTVTGLSLSQNANALVSYSKDGIIKVWSFAGANFPAKIPFETICDHESKIRCSDTYEWLLGTFDSEGKITIRDLRKPQECIATLNLANVTKYQQFCFCDNVTFAVGNSSAVELYNMEGQFINMLDLEEEIRFMSVQGAYLVAVLETGRVVIMDWQKASKVAEATFEEAFEDQDVVCGYLSKTTEKIMLGTKSGAVITIC